MPRAASLALPHLTAPARADRDDLAGLPSGVAARIVGLDVEIDEGAMLRAMGIAEGQEVRVLRRAPTGDPLHVRFSSGGEFAIAGPLARAIRIERLP